MAKAQTKEVAPVNAAPAYLDEYRAGKIERIEDNFSSADVVIPQIKLVQGTSKSILEAYDDAKPGIFWHNGFDVSLGQEFRFIPCSRRKRLMLLAPMEDGQGVLARADDCKTWDRTGEWKVKLKDVPEPVTWRINDLSVHRSGHLGPDDRPIFGTANPNDPNSPPAATLFYDYLVICPDHMDYGPAVISLFRSQIKHAKRGLNQKVELFDNPRSPTRRPMQSIIFKAKRGSEGDGQQGYYIWQFSVDGFANDEQFKEAHTYAAALQNYEVKDLIKDVSEDAEAKPAAPASGGASFDGEMAKKF